MKNIIIFDDPATHMNLLPITYTRPISYIRVGITTIYEKWQYFIKDAEFSSLVDPYLMKKFPTTITDENYFIAGHIYPCDALVEAIFKLDKGTALLSPSEQLIAFRGTMEDFDKKKFTSTVTYCEEPKQLHWLYDIFLHNDEQLRLDFRRLSAGRKSQSLSPTNRLIGDHEFDDGTSKYFIEEGASIEGAIINVTNGPIYIGKDATIMEGSCIRAPFAACEHSQVNMGAKIYGATTLGPYCKVGGELNNVVMIGYSNKAHDGFLGNAVIGEWCNIGGGTTASNLPGECRDRRMVQHRRWHNGIEPKKRLHRNKIVELPRTPFPEDGAAILRADNGRPLEGWHQLYVQHGYSDRRGSKHTWSRIPTQLRGLVLRRLDGWFLGRFND